MKEGIIKNHSLLSDTEVSFLKYAVEQEKCVNKINLLDSDLPLLFRDYEHTLNSWPIFISNKMKDNFANCVCNIAKLISKAIHLEFKADVKRMAQFYEVPEILAAVFMDGKVNMEEIPIRIDAILGENGLKILEVNVGSTVGGWQIRWMDKQYRKQPELAPFFERTDCRLRDIPQEFFEYLIEAILLNHFDLDRSINILIVVDKEFLKMDGPGIFKEIFNNALKTWECSGNLFFDTSYDQISFKPDGAYFANSRMGALMSANRGPSLNPPIELFRAYLAKQIFWPDNPFFGLVGDKRSLAILYKHKDASEISDEERSLIKRFVPWSETFTKKDVIYEGQEYDLEALALQHQDKFVIKVSSGMQGIDVYAGKYQTEKEWKAIVERALRDGTWLVQEYCMSLPFYGQSGSKGYDINDIIWGIFGFGSRYGGCWLRLMQTGSGKGIINSARGAEETIVYEVEKSS